MKVMKTFIALAYCLSVASAIRHAFTLSSLVDAGPPPKESPTPEPGQSSSPLEVFKLLRRLELNYCAPCPIELETIKNVTGLILDNPKVDLSELTSVLTILRGEQKTMGKCLGLNTEEELMADAMGWELLIPPSRCDPHPSKSQCEIFCKNLTLLETPLNINLSETTLSEREAWLRWPQALLLFLDPYYNLHPTEEKEIDSLLREKVPESPDYVNPFIYLSGFFGPVTPNVTNITLEEVRNMTSTVAEVTKVDQKLFDWNPFQFSKLFALRND